MDDKEDTFCYFWCVAYQDISGVTSYTSGTTQLKGVVHDHKAYSLLKTMLLGSLAEPHRAGAQIIALNLIGASNE